MKLFIVAVSNLKKLVRDGGKLFK